jgi:hypothetical protein
MARRIFALSAVVLLQLLLAGQAGAQPAQERWGITASFVPSWVAMSDLKILFKDAQNLDYKGSEFRIGLLRGKEFGSDWSVTYVVRNVNEGSTIDSTETSDFGAGPPLKYGSLYSVEPSSPVKIRGIEGQKFSPLATIKNRAQIGLVFGGGIGWYHGQMTAHNYDVTYTNGPPPTFQPIMTETQTVTQVEAKDLFAMSFVPMGRVEIAGAAILAPGLKVRVSGGFSFPNTQVFSVTVNYLFGTK